MLLSGERSRLSELRAGGATLTASLLSTFHGRENRAHTHTHIPAYLQRWVFKIKGTLYSNYHLLIILLLLHSQLSFSFSPRGTCCPMCVFFSFRSSLSTFLLVLQHRWCDCSRRRDRRNRPPPPPLPWGWDGGGGGIAAQSVLTWRDAASSPRVTTLHPRRSSRNTPPSLPPRTPHRSDFQSPCCPPKQMLRTKAVPVRGDAG